MRAENTTIKIYDAQFSAAECECAQYLNSIYQLEVHRLSGITPINPRE